MSPIHKKKKIPSEEAEDSSSKSSTNHKGSRRFFPNGSHIYTTPQQVHPYYSSLSFSSLSNSCETEDTSPCTSTPQRVFTISSGPNNQDYSCTYPLGIEHAGMVEKGREWRKRPRSTRGKSLTRKGRERNEEDKRNKSPREV